MKLVSDGILAILLPTEDLESGCERTLLREILSSLVFGNVLDKLSEPFMIYELIATAVRQLRPDLVPPPPEPSPTPRRGSVKPGVRLSPPPDPPRPLPPPRNALERSFSLFVKALSTLYSVLASFHYILLNPLPPRPNKRRPIIRTALPSCVSTFFNLRALQPWLPATLRLISKPFESRATTVGALLDDLLISKIYPHLSSPKLVVGMLKLARTALFPGDALGPPRKYPSEKQKAIIRAETELVLLDVVPRTVTNMWWKGMDREEMAKEVGRNWLDAFGEKEINKVLVVRLIDLVISRLLPELLESGGAEIRKHRTGPDPGFGLVGKKSLEVTDLKA